MMELPDCPPGAEGYEDSVVETPKKVDETTCTKAEQEFLDHLNSLKIRLDNGDVRCMVERRGRDISGKWIYLCYPCAAMCSGEAILQTHISGKKHKFKLSSRTSWPESIFNEHPFNNQRSGATEKVLQKMAAEVENYKQPRTNPSEDDKFKSYLQAPCRIQATFDTTKAPLIGLEYLVEHPPQESHHEPSYLCTLCTKQGHPRTIVNHITSYWHRCNYFHRYFPKAMSLLMKYQGQSKYRDGVHLIVNRLAQRIEDVCGKLKPICIEKEEFDRYKERIMQGIIKGYHITENTAGTMEEVVDTDLIESIYNDDLKDKSGKKDPSPPVVAAPSKPFNANRLIRPRRKSADSLSDISDEELGKTSTKPIETRNQIQAFKSRYAVRYVPEKEEKVKVVNINYKMEVAESKRKKAEEAAKKSLAYHEKNPEKHPLYPEEWKKFWNRRYKDLQAEGKDPSKHDFKPEWIVFWTKRMKELHDEELRLEVLEIYRKLNLSPSLFTKTSSEEKRQSAERRSRDSSRLSAERKRRLPDVHMRSSPEHRRRSPESRRRSPYHRHRSPDARRRSPHDRRRSPENRHRSPEKKRISVDRVRRSVDRRERSPAYRSRRSPPSHRSRSPIPKRLASPVRLHINPESLRSHSPRRSSRSPLSRRNDNRPLRNRSPTNRTELAPSLQTVLISDEELGNDDLSPWNSDNDMESASRASAPRSHVGSSASHARSSRSAAAAAVEGADNVVATLRMLVALEDYLGSLGPRVVALLTDALTMEKERANSSEELLEREAALVLIETAKEKLKGAAQAGLVPPAAAPAVRAAVVRAAATLHEADLRRTQRQKTEADKPKAVPVAGVGEVDRAQIAQQMAAALIAQGKTDVTSEELAQLVDAVVGMAEAKKREAEAAKKPPAAPSAVPLSGASSALQMLQSAYDENDKRMEKEKADAPDAMDGLSDSDLETLLKNFNELSAEEQHSLIAYLKKLEAREPQRVERLRQYVSAAAASAPPAAPPAPPAQPALAIDSDDDDDYTVEEVLEAATQKVKEDQIRQEMEIVKKSLQESTESSEVKAPVTSVKNQTSATDLLALVHASIQSTAGGGPASVDVLAPRLFGDTPAPPAPAASRPPPAAMDYDTSHSENSAGYSKDTINHKEPGGFNNPAGYNNEPVGYNNDPKGYNNEPTGYNNEPTGYNNEPAGYNNEPAGYNNEPADYNESIGYDNEPAGYNESASYNNDPAGYNESVGYNEPVSHNNESESYNNEPVSYNDSSRAYNNESGHNDRSAGYDRSDRFNAPNNFGQNAGARFNRPPVWNNEVSFNSPMDGRGQNQGFGQFGQSGPSQPFNSGPRQYNPGPNQYNNHAQRGNFNNRNNRSMDNKNQNQFGNNQGKSRGRGGRGNYGRGRGRGRF